MTYDQAIKKMDDISYAAKEAHLLSIDVSVRNMEKKYRAAMKKVQNHIMVYGEIPGEQFTTLLKNIDKEIDSLSRQLVKQVAGNVNTSVKAGIIDTISQGKVISNSLAYGGKVKLTSGSFSRIWRTATNKMLTSQDGILLSDRIWDVNRATLMDIKKHLAVGFMEGKYPSQLADDIRGFLILPDADMRKKKWIKFFKENPPGRGVYKSAAKNLERIIRTESGRAYRLGTEEYAKNKSWVKGMKWNRIPGQYECGECEALSVWDEGLGPGVYAVGTVPVTPHPNCQCYLTIVPLEEYVNMKILTAA